MKIIETVIKKGEWLLDALNRIGYDMIPSNTILDKTLTGLGATHTELNSNRNSIIIEPNVPVIIGKEKKHKHVLGVYEGVSEKQISDYLQDTSIHVKKILTTPEGYIKVKNAAQDAGVNLQQDFFLLFDECEKAIQDVVFRESIINPFFDLFDYQNKALISATPLYAELKGFESECFKKIRIVPDYDYRQNIQLILTNNIIEEVKKVFMGDNKKAVFINSIEYAKELITLFNIQKESNLYTSKNGVKELKSKDGIQFSFFDSFEGELKKYNFFTSRYYSAVDLEIPDKPDVIIVTDCISKPQTMIDPATHTVQIAGRFRNGYNSLTHISNINSSITFQTEEEIRETLKKQHEFFMTISALDKYTNDPIIQNFLKEILERVSLGDYMYKSGKYKGKINGFMVVNKIEFEKYKSYYTNGKNLVSAYKIDHFNVNDINSYYEKPSGMFGVKNRITKESRKDMLHKLQALKPEIKDGNVPIIFHTKEQEKELSKIRKNDTLLYEIYCRYGSEKIIEVDYNTRKMNSLLNKSEKETIYLQLLDEVLSTFKLREKYTEEDIVKKLQIIYDKYKLTNNGQRIIAKATDLKYYFNIGKRTTVKRIKGKEYKGYEILEYKYIKPKDE